MTAPGRPLQNLLATIQFGEQLRLQRAAEDRMNRATSANILQTFSQLASASRPEDRMAVANLLAPQLNVTPEQLTATVANRPVSAATVGDEAAGLQLDSMRSMFPRIRDAVAQIPDPTVRDLALNAAAQQFAGQPAGQARMQGAMADSTKTPQDEINNGVMRQLGSMMSAPQLMEFTQSAERIRQGWTQLADQKVATAVDQALRRSELGFRMNLARLQQEGVNTKGMETESPAKLMTELFEMTKELTSKPQTQAARAMFTWPIMSQYQRLLTALGGRENVDPEVLSQMDKTFAPENIVNASPTFWTQFWGKKDGGTKK